MKAIFPSEDGWAKKENPPELPFKMSRLHAHTHFSKKTIGLDETYLNLSVKTLALLFMTFVLIS